MESKKDDDKKRIIFTVFKDFPFYIDRVPFVQYSKNLDYESNHGFDKKLILSGCQYNETKYHQITFPKYQQQLKQLKDNENDDNANINNNNKHDNDIVACETIVHNDEQRQNEYFFSRC